ncbi:MAG: GNAT family N-acetyltransferase [Bacteroidetes bacterium]|nr:GNAT family N-acetyltransferase [Bacteroidota bacterium]
MKLITDRLIIDQFKVSDIPEWCKIEADAEVRRFVDGKTLNAEQAAGYIHENIKSYLEHGFGRYAVRLKDDPDAIIGMCGFVQEEYGIDFGYRYAVSSWRKGYGIEAAQAVLNYGRNDLALAKIIGMAVAENHGSNRILELLGFTLVENLVIHGFSVKKYVIETP